MADENLGASFSIDITELKAGLAQANRLIRESESEFRAAAAGMDDWSSSQEGLEKRINSLNDQIGIQQKKVDALAAEKERLIAKMTEEGKSHEDIARAVDDVNKSIEREGKQLDRLRNELKKNETALDGLDQATEETADSIEEMADSAEEAGRSFEGLKSASSVAVGAIGAIAGAATAAIGAFFGLAEGTREYREAQAKLNSAFEAGGHSAETAQGAYETLFGVIGEGDQAVEAAQQISMLAKSEEDVAKWADLASGVVGQFGDALQPETFFESANETLKLGEATGAYVQMLEQKGIDVEKFNENLSKCTTEAEKQAYMLEVAEGALGEAGKAYEEAAADIIESNKATAEFEATLAELGAIAEPIMTELKKMATDLLKAISPFVDLIGDGLKGAMDGVDGSAEKMAEGIGGILDVILDTATDMLPMLIELVAELIPQIVTSIISKIPQLLDLAVESVVMIVNALSKALPTIVTEFAKLIPKIMNSLITAIPLLLQAGIDLFMALVDAIPVVLPILYEALPTLIDSLLDTLTDAIPLLLDGAIQLLMAIVDAIPVILDVLTEKAPEIVQQIIDGLLECLPLLLSAAIELLDALVQAIPVIVRELGVKVPGIVSSIVTTLLNNLPALIKGATTLFFGILKAIPAIIKELAVQVPSIVSEIASALEDGVAKMKTAGSNLLIGIWNGISDKVAWLKQQVMGVVDKIKSWFTGKDGFDENSPSKWSEGVMKYVMDGFEIGASKYTGEDVRGLVGEMKDGMRKGITDDATSALGGTGTLASGRNVTINQTNNYSQAHSRFEIFRSKQETVSAVKLALGGAMA